MTETLIIYILACFATTNTFGPMLGEGTRVVHDKLWKIINLPKNFALVIVTRLNYVIIAGVIVEF